MFLAALRATKFSMGGTWVKPRISKESKSSHVVSVPLPFAPAMLRSRVQKFKARAQFESGQLVVALSSWTRVGVHSEVN